MPTNQQKQLLVFIGATKRNFPQFLSSPLRTNHHDVSPLSISLWLGVPGYLYCDVVWSSELFVLRCGLEFRAICISLWLGVPSYFYCDVVWILQPNLYFAVAWSSEPSDLFLLSQVPQGKEKNKG